MRTRVTVLEVILLAAALSSCNSTSTLPTPGVNNVRAQTPASINTVTALEAPAEGVVVLGPGGGGAFDVFAFSPDYVFAGTDLGGVFRSADHGQSWQTANQGLFDYMINDLAVDPSRPKVLYAATPGGVYKSEDSGDSWMLLTNGFPPKDASRYSAEIGTVAVDPLNPDIVYAGLAEIRAEQIAEGNGDVYRSNDAGASWTKLNLGDPNAALYKIVVDPLHDNDVYVAASNGFFRSSDSGQTWAHVDTMQSRGLVAGIDNRHAQVVLYRAAWTAGVYRSQDGGATWRKLSNIRCPHSCEFYRMALDPSDPQARKVYVGDYGDWNKDQGIFATSDGGSSWQQINTIVDAGWAGSNRITRVRSLGLNPYRPGELYYGTSMGVFRTEDARWQQVYTTDIAPTGGESLAWPGRWHSPGNISNTQANTKPMFDPANYARYYLGFSDLYIWGTQDNGITWENIQLPGDNDVRALVADPKDTSFLTWFASSAAQECCSGALYKTTDGGRNWRRASGLPSDRILDLAVSTLDSDLIYAATSNHGVYLSTNGGVSFAAQNGEGEDALPAGSTYRVELDARTSGTLYAAIGDRSGGIFKTTDGGVTWLRSGVLTDCYAVALSPMDSQLLFAGCGLELYVSKDDGAQWNVLFDARDRSFGSGTKLSSGYIRDIALYPSDPRILCLVIKDDPYHDQASGGGLHCTLDGGATWKEVASPLRLLLRGTAVAFHPLPDPVTGNHDLFYMTGGNGAYRIPFQLLLKVIQEAPPE